MLAYFDTDFIRQKSYLFHLLIWSLGIISSLHNTLHKIVLCGEYKVFMGEENIFLVGIS